MNKNTLMKEASIFEILFVNAPEPSKEAIRLSMQMDQQKNPHNDSYKPALRSEQQIIADYKFDYAQAMVRRFNERNGQP